MLCSNLRKKLKNEQRESGIAVEVTAFDHAIETIIEIEDAAEEMRLPEANQKQSTEADTAKAEHVRKKQWKVLGKLEREKTVERKVEGEVMGVTHYVF